jgi:hypothetical protein
VRRWVELANNVVQVADIVSHFKSLKSLSARANVPSLEDTLSKYGKHFMWATYCNSGKPYSMSLENFSKSHMDGDPQVLLMWVECFLKCLTTKKYVSSKYAPEYPEYVHRRWGGVPELLIPRKRLKVEKSKLWIYFYEMYKSGSGCQIHSFYTNPGKTYRFEGLPDYSSEYGFSKAQEVMQSIIDNIIKENENGISI